MRKVARLIAQMCPHGVALKSLGELEDSGIVKLGRGHVISKGDLENSPGDHPVYSSSAIGTGEFGRYGKFMFEDERITWSIDGGGRFFYRHMHKYSVTNVCGWLKVLDGHALNIRFLYHFLSGTWETKVFDYTKKAHPSVIRDEYSVALPPLEVQVEIARILDTFTELTTDLTAELTAELTARKKQYNYYRDRLFSFEGEEVNWITLGDVTKKWYSGGTPTAGVPEYYEDGDIPWLRTQEVKFSDIDRTEIKITQAAIDNSAVKWIPANCVIVAISGATAGRSAINKIPLTTNQHCGCLEIDSAKALYRYVFHWVSFNHENIKSLGQGARGDLNSSIIKGFKFPLPFADDPEKSLEEQARIVAILDKFNALTNSLTEGLPREIELRQKQYEHYRNLLLSFPKPEALAN